MDGGGSWEEGGGVQVGWNELAISVSWGKSR